MFTRPNSLTKLNSLILVAVLFVGSVLGVTGYATYNKKVATTSSNILWRYYGNESDVDGKVTGSTTIINTGDGEFHPMLITVETLASSGVIVPAIISIGTNSPNYNNIVSTATVGSLLNGIDVGLLDGVSLVPANTDIKVRVITAATATTQTFRVSMHGHTGFP